MRGDLCKYARALVHMFPASCRRQAMAMACHLPLSLHSSTFLLSHRRPALEPLAAPDLPSVSGTLYTNSQASSIIKPSLQSSPFWNGARGRLDWRRSVAIGSTRRMEGSPLQIEATLEKLEEAARTTVDYFVRSGMSVGLGTGLASSMAINYIGEKLRNGSLRDIIGVPMSSAGASAAARAGVPLASFEEQPQLDIAFDDADAVQEGTLFAVVGRRGVEGRQSILKEKGIIQYQADEQAIMKAATQMVFIIEEKQFVGSLEGAVPVLIQQEDWIDVAEEIDDLFLGDAEVWRRPSFGEAGPLGGDNPLVTPEGHYVLDVIFTTPITTAAEVVENLEAIGGVMGHGLVMDTAYAAAIAGSNGVKIRTSLFKTAFTSME